MVKDTIEFIKGIYSTSDFIPLHAPTFVGNEKKYLMDCIDSTFVSSVGEYVDRFEEMMCEITGAEHAIAIVNGTNALHLSLILAGVEEGDEVLTQSLTFVATANAIKYCNAIPNFVDVDEDTLGLSPSKLETYLNNIAELRDGICYNKISNNKISGCVPMHTFGLPMKIDELLEVCSKFNIPVIEDAAESLGSLYNDKHTGTFGTIGVFSFNGNKIVTSGGGGAIVTNNEALAKKAKHLSTQAKIQHRWEYRHDHIGYNYRMPNINAALLCAQLEKLPFYVKNKRELSDKYFEFFKKYPEVEFIREITDSKSNYWLNAIKLEDRSKRDDFLEYTNNNAVMTRPIWCLMSDLEMFKNCPKSDLSASEDLSNRIVNIPSSVIV